MNWFWHALWICLVVIPVTILWIVCVVSIFVRHDLSIWARIGWVLVVLILPLLGALVYLLFSPSVLWRDDSGTMPTPGRPTTVPTEQIDTREPGSLVSDISAAQRLHDSGALTDEEFQAAKTKLLNAPQRQPSDSTAINVG